MQVMESKRRNMKKNAQRGRERESTRNESERDMTDCDFTTETRIHSHASRFSFSLSFFLLLDPEEKKRKALPHSRVENGFSRQVLQQFTLTPHTI